MLGLTYDSDNGLLFLSDSNNNLYTVTGLLAGGALHSGTFAAYSSVATGKYSAVEGVSYVTDMTTPYLLGGGGPAGVYSLNPLAAGGNNIVVSTLMVRDVRNRLTVPSSASVNTAYNLTLVSEETLTTPSYPWVHIILPSNLVWDGRCARRYA